jgi:hypothetical protein
VEAAVPVGLEFGLAPERLDEGSPEERAAFGLFSLRTAQQSLTEGFDYFLNGFRQGPLVSGYHVAEWLAWNWWRLRWEPRSAAPDWSLAHTMTSIGEGYVWPNLEIWSDGAVGEVAAQRARASANENAVLTARGLEAIAQAIGHAASSRDTLALQPNERLPRQVDVPAWRLGADAADAVRRQERLGGAALSGERLAQMAGTTSTALTAQPRGDAVLSYALDDATGAGSKIVLPGRRETARRFALARVVGDRLMHRSGALHPATHAYTYRQKAQRSFAAELLAPFEAVEDMLRGDYSEDRQQDVADYFLVSPMVVNTLLKNHGRIERDLPDEDFYATVA